MWTKKQRESPGASGSTLIGLLALAACAHAPSIQYDGRDWRLDEVVDSVVELHRQVLVLADERDHSAEGRDALVIARHLSQRARDQLGLVAQGIGGDRDAADALVTRIRQPALRDGDRLAFHDLVLDLPGTPDVQAAQARLDRIQRSYASRMNEILTRVGTRGIAAPLEPWDDYAAFLRARYDRAELLSRYARYRTESAPRARSAGVPLPSKSVVVTLEGSSRRQAVLEVLARYGVTAAFAEAGAPPWTVDALDWADPFPESVAARVVREIDRAEGGVVVLRGDQRETPLSLPLIIERLRATGYTFVDPATLGRP